MSSTQELKKHEQRLVWNRNRNKLKMISVDSNGIMEFSKAFKRELHPGQRLLIWNYGGWIMIATNRIPLEYGGYSGWIEREIGVHDLHYFVSTDVEGVSHIPKDIVYGIKNNGNPILLLGLEWLCFGPLDTEFPIVFPENYSPYVMVGLDCDMCFDHLSAVSCGLMDCRAVVFGEDDNGEICFAPVSKYEAVIDKSLESGFIKPFLREYDKKMFIYEVDKFDVEPGTYLLKFGTFEDGRPWIRLSEVKEETEE